MHIEENLNEIRSRAARAAERVGRKPEEITLVAVSKMVTSAEVAVAMSAGQYVFGENRVQSLLDKIETLPAAAEHADCVRWHLIGHLQTNKVKYILDKVDLIHSLDSLHLAGEISRCAAARGLTAHCLLQMNISGEESKHGLHPDELEPFVEAFLKLDHIVIDGLMTMAPLGAEEKELRKIFGGLRKISIDMQRESMHNINMSCLSMGMSGDFETAIEEGATLIRVGTGIFH